jgi:hypothetical protein
MAFVESGLELWDHFSVTPAGVNCVWLIVYRWLRSKTRLRTGYLPWPPPGAKEIFAQWSIRTAKEIAVLGSLGTPQKIPAARWIRRAKKIRQRY